MDERPEIELQIESVEITARTRKLKAVWSYEAQQDLIGLYGDGIEDTDLIREIYREIKDVRNSKVNWKEEGF